MRYVRVSTYRATQPSEQPFPYAYVATTAGMISCSFLNNSTNDKTGGGGQQQFVVKVLQHSVNSFSLRWVMV